MKKLFIVLLMLVGGLACYDVLHAFDDEIDIMDDEVDVAEESDEGDIEKQIEELRKLVGDAQRVKRLFSALEKREADENIVAPCLISGFSKGIGMKRFELFEHYLSLHGDADLVVYYISEEGDEVKLQEYFARGGPVKFFEKVYDHYSVELTHSMLEAYVGRVQETNAQEAKVFIKKFVRALEEIEEEAEAQESPEET